MDDDLTFGVSVWATPIDPLPPQPQPQPQPGVGSDSVGAFPAVDEDGFDSFDDFGAPIQAEASGDVEDDEFGDFGDTQGEVVEGFDDDDFVDEEQSADPSHATWEPLRLNPLPSRAELHKQVNALIEPIFGYGNMSQFTTDEDIREMEGIAQILTTPQSQEMYKMLTGPLPQLKPPNWKRSRIRRQHLIALGLPVNLDECLPRANGKPMPTLNITTRPTSLPPESKNTSTAPGTSRVGTPRSGTPHGRRPAPSPFGPKPELNEKMISELLELKPTALSLLPLPTLDRHLADIQAQTAHTSSLLKYLLQTRESLQQDSETYNRLIGELVGEAQKMKSGKGRPR